MHSSISLYSKQVISVSLDGFKSTKAIAVPRADDLRPPIDQGGRYGASARGQLVAINGDPGRVSRVANDLARGLDAGAVEVIPGESRPC
jgi:hypothetical protein